MKQYLEITFWASRLPTMWWKHKSLFSVNSTWQHMFNFSKSLLSKLMSPMRALIGVKICLAALNRHSHSELTDRGVFVSKNNRLMSWHAVTVIVSVDVLGRYSSSCVRTVELSHFLTKKSSSELSDAWSSGVASCLAVRCRLMNLKPFLNKKRNIVAIITIEFKLITLNLECEYARDWTVLITLILPNGWTSLWSCW